MNCITFILQMNTLRRIRIHLEEAEKDTNLKVERILLRSRGIDRLSEREFFTLVRLRKRTFHEILEQLEPHLRCSRYNSGIRAETKLLTALRFFAQGSYQKSVGNDIIISMSQPSISKVLKEVVDVMNKYLCPKYITFPNSEERTKIKEWFCKEHSIPNVIGVIDGSHIGIYPPNQESLEHVYVNRKSFHSINVQLIVDHNYKILNIVAKFPGSSHDSYIWRMSSIRNCLQNEYVQKGTLEWLLGDSGYPLEPWLMTPIARVADADDVLYNNHFRVARSLVERAIGLLKGRWRCLCKQWMLHYAPTMASKIINACAALHNICIMQNDCVLMEEEKKKPDEEDETLHNQTEVVELFDIGEQRRNYIIAYMKLMR